MSVSSSPSTPDALNHRSAKDDDERAKLVIAAKQVLERSGWWGFKVESVLRQAHLSTRSFYRHFDKKTDLLAALMEMELGGAAVKLRRLTAASTNYTERIDSYIGGLIDMAYEAELSRPSSLFASRWREMLPEYGEAIDRCVQQMLQPLIDVMIEGGRDGELMSPDPIADAKAVFYWWRA